MRKFGITMNAYVIELIHPSAIGSQQHPLYTVQTHRKMHVTWYYLKGLRGLKRERLARGWICCLFFTRIFHGADSKDSV